MPKSIKFTKNTIVPTTPPKPTYQKIAQKMFFPPTIFELPHHAKNMVVIERNVNTITLSFF